MKKGLPGAASFFYLQQNETMFSFFRKKHKGTLVTDLVFISGEAKLKALTEKIRQSENIAVITWFDQSFAVMEEHNAAENLFVDVHLARTVTARDVKDKQVIFFEHYPLHNREIDLMEQLQLRETRFYSSLDEPLFKFFGGENLPAMISRLGLAANEGVKHPLITAAIKNAQENIQKKMNLEPSAASQEEWLRKAIG
jgi:hypothetical protein